MAKDTTDKNFENDVLNYQGKVLVDFWAPWCGPCKMLGPIIERVAEEAEGKAQVYKLNVDDNKEISAKYNITGIPTVILFENGNVVEELVGVQEEELYLKKLLG